VHRYIEQCRDGLERALANLSPADAEVSTGGVWSIANIVEHLDLTYAKNAAGLARRLIKADAPAHSRSVRQAAARFVVVTLGYFPPGRKSPDQVVPQGRPFTEVAAGLGGHLLDLDRSLSEGERVFGGTRAVLDHPIIGPLSVADWRRFHWVHTRHHLRQIVDRSAKSNVPRPG